MVEKKQNKIKPRRAIKSRLFNVHVTEQKLKGNEAYVAGVWSQNASILNVS